MYTGCSMATEIEMDFDNKCSKMKRKKAFSSLRIQEQSTMIKPLQLDLVNKPDKEQTNRLNSGGVQLQLRQSTSKFYRNVKQLFTSAVADCNRDNQ